MARGALGALEPFIGTWDMDAVFPKGREVPEIGGDVSCTFEWILGGRYLLQRSVAPDPIPNAHSLIGWDAGTDRFLQHYFDSRGVTRVYAMAFDGQTWTLDRTEADFSPLDFRQRYIGTFSADGRTIEGEWQIAEGDGPLEHDFGLTFRRR